MSTIGRYLRAAAREASRNPFEVVAAEANITDPAQLRRVLERNAVMLAPDGSLARVERVKALAERLGMTVDDVLGAALERGLGLLENTAREGTTP